MLNLRGFIHARHEEFNHQDVAFLNLLIGSKETRNVNATLYY